MSLRFTISSVALIAFGCASVEDGEDGEIETRKDGGRLCVAPPSGRGDPSSCPLVELVENEKLRLEVDFDECLSSSCDSDLETSCNATIDGSIITVTAHASWRHVDGACTDDCGFVRATCEVGPLPAGSYELRYGVAGSVALAVPSVSAHVCTGSSWRPGCCDDDLDCGADFCLSGHVCSLER